MRMKKASRIACVILLSASVGAAAFAKACFCAGFDDNGDSGFKVTVKSMPFLSDDEDEPDRPRSYDDYNDFSEKEYTYDATGRRVPVATEKAGTARPLGKQLDRAYD
jgi:hypothetical protein